MAEMERDMLRLQHEVEMHGTVFSAAKSACRLLFPDLDEADVSASDFVLPSLHRLRKAEADRGVAKAQLLIARILDRVCLTRGDIRSPDSELSRAEVAKCEAIVAAARAAHHCANLGSTDAAANASPDVRVAVAELEVAERQVAVDAARATMFRMGLSKKDADASTNVVEMLQALHKAREDRRVLPAQIKVDACDAAVAAALFELFTGVKMPNFSDLKTKLENLAEAKGVMAMQRAMPTVEEKRDAVKDQKLQLELKVDMFSAKLADANACTKDPLVKDVALQLVTYLNSWLESAVADKNMFIAKQQILECEAALDAAKIDFVSEHPDVIAASKTVSEKLKLLDEAKSTVAILERKEIANRSIWYFGLPGPLVPSGSARPAASSPAVPGLKVVGATMAAVSPLPRILPTLPKLWCTLSKKVVSSKFDVFCAVASTLEEVADLVLSQATLSSHYQLLHLVPGFGVLRDDILKKLAAIVDVKFPGTLEKPFGETGHDQIYMDLVIAFQNYECAAPLGILTSYNHWQFCWLEQASLIAEATSIDEVKQFSVQPPSVPSLKLCVSEVFSFDDPQLVKFLASFLLKVCATPPGLQSRVLTHHYTETGSGPKANGPERSALKLYQMVRDDASDFFAVRLLDYGAEGVVLLMATETGACCAVKTPLPTQNALGNFITMIESDPRKLMVDEREAWENAYPLKDYPDVKVRVVVLNNSPALIMPFYEQLSDDDWENPDTVSMVREHIHALALRGVFHRDVQRRHVVWAHGREDVRLIDWGRISTASGKSCDPKTFTDDSMRRLCDG